MVDKFIASLFIVLGLLQAETMFAGALAVSYQTNWPRLGAYFQREIVALQQAGSTQEAAQPAPKRKTQRNVNLSTRPDEEPEQRRIR